MPTNKNRPNSDYVFTKYEVISATENTATESAGLGTQSDKIHKNHYIPLQLSSIYLRNRLKMPLKKFSERFFHFFFLTHPEPCF
jgi:hypothetical protein